MVSTYAWYGERALCGMRKPGFRWYFSPRVSSGILGKSWRVAEAQLPPQDAHDASFPFIELSESWRHLFLEGLSKGKNVKHHAGVARVSLFLLLSMYIVCTLVYGAPSLSFWKWARGRVLLCSSGVNAKVLAIFFVLKGVSELHIIAISLKMLLMNRPFCAGLAWINICSLLFLICLTPNVQWLQQL